MNIDIRFKDGDGGYRYEADFIPRKGDTISIPKDDVEYRVIDVDHLIHKGMNDKCKLSLITITVTPVKNGT